MADLMDEIIRKAREAGHFDNLPGAGKPLNLDDNPNEDPATRLANHILRNGGFVWPWLEERQELEADLQSARDALAREPRSARAAETFRQAVAALNRRILAHNLKVPSPAFQRAVLNADAEINRLTRTGSRD
ncbi:MAG: DUF1992 domain-containing protein [Chloroflexi bacterium]|nr:DUF1992 domain-containing protein [Chloroflexota bacterium]